MSQSQYESSEDENESEEHQAQEDEYYEEMRGEYDDDEYEQEGEEYWYINSNRESLAKPRSRSSKSSQQTSRGSSATFRPRKSLKKSIFGGLRYSISEEETQHQDNQDLIDSLPEDISNALLDYWDHIGNAYYPVNEKSFEGINKAHRKLLEYPSFFQEQLAKQLDGPDDRMGIAEQFKSDFNRLPLLTRSNDQIKPILYQRISELMIKIEGVTEEKYAKSKSDAYKILSKGVLTTESEKLAKLFGTLLQVETDRFSDTIKFINEHYYSTIAIDLALPNKVRWKEILDIGLIKKKFLCDHYREQCLLREELGESWNQTGNASSSDSDICGGGTRGQDLTLVCEDETDSTPTDEEMSRDSRFQRYGEDDEEMEFGEGKMNGEMKLSLEFDNDEFLGENGWEFYPSTHRNSAQSGATTGRSDLGRNNEDGDNKLVEDDKASKSSSKKGKGLRSTGSVKSGSLKKTSKDNASQKGNVVEKKKSSKGEGTRKGGSKSEKRKTNQQDYEEEEEEEDAKNLSHFDEQDEEELEMEPDRVEVETRDLYEDEYPGEFWEGEGYRFGSYRISEVGSRKRESSVKFDEKETYIRDFFWDSDPSKQDETDMSKLGPAKEKEECTDEGYFDQEELFDDEDVFYDRDEFFEKDVESLKKGTKKNTSTPEPEHLHFAVFGREKDLNYNNLSLLNTLLLKWATRQQVVAEKKFEEMPAEVGFAGGEVQEENIENYDNRKPEVNEHEEEEEEDEWEGDGSYKDRDNKSFSSSAKAFSPTTPLSTAKRIDTYQKPAFISAGTPMMMDGVNGTIRTSFLDTDFFRENNDLLNLHPTTESHDMRVIPTSEMVRLKRPLLYCFINLQDEIWSGFEMGFREARKNIEKVMSSLKEVVSRAYPIEDPKDKDPCEEETDVNELLAKAEAIKDRYHSSIKHSDRTSKAPKHVHLQRSFEGEEELVEIEGERESSPEQEEDNEEEDNENIGGTPKSSFVELVPLQSGKNSAELELIEQEHHQSHEKKSSLADSEQRSKKEKRVSIDESGSLKKKSVIVHDSGSGSNQGKKRSMDDGKSEGGEKEHEKRSSIADSGNALGLELENSLEMVDSPQSDHRTESTDRKSVYLERTPADTDIRLPAEEAPTDTPSPEEQRILKRARHALLKSKLMNWEVTIELEAERLLRQLALIEAHAQHEFRLLKQLPMYIWESSKGQAANVYIDDLAKDAELREVFRCAVNDGSALYGKFYIDRRDLMLLVKDNDTPIPLKFTEAFLEFSNIMSKKKSKKSEYMVLEE